MRQADLVRHAADAARRASRSHAHGGIVAGWSVNELAADARAALLESLIQLADAGDAILIIEPIATGVSPWWREWQHRFAAVGGRADEWRFETPLPHRLAELSEAAGFRRDSLTAKSLWLAR